jgi:hypothetical protein
MAETKLWIVISYNIQDNHDADVVGVFETEKLAVKKILKVIKQEFVSTRREKLEDDYRFKNIEWNWNDIKKYYEGELEYGECIDIVNSLGYKISPHSIQTYFERVNV